VGRIRQRIISVSGCRTSGKTVYHWALLHQLRDRLSRHAPAFSVPMFEDQKSYEQFQRLHNSIVHDHKLPAMTFAVEQKKGKIDPIIVRLLQLRSNGRIPQTNLIFYDHAGELIEALSDVSYLRYLAHSNGIIYLVDPDDGGENARDGLNAIFHQIRAELGLGEAVRLNIPLAVVLSKADKRVYPEIYRHKGKDSILPDCKNGSGFWQLPLNQRRAQVSATSATCRWFMNSQLQLHDLIALAENSFHQVRYFAVSALNGASSANVPLAKCPEPVGVEHPLYWIFGEMG
jgi:hypothetical protein